MGREPPDDVANAMEREIDTLRSRIEDLLLELERRVDGAKHTVERVKSGIHRAREFADVPAQLRAHPKAATGAGVVTLAALGFGLWALLARRAENRRLLPRMKRRAVAYRALLADPERALRPRVPSVGMRVIAAVAIAAATALTKRLLTRRM